MPATPKERTPDPSDGAKNLSYFTLDQASEMLQRIKKGELQLVEGGLLLLPVDTRHAVAYRNGLERLGEPVFEHWRKLKTFYLAGCAYQNGATSLAAVAKQLEELDLKKALPRRVPTSTSSLSGFVSELAEYVFGPYFEATDISLLTFPNGEGTGGVLIPDGWRAWKATREFLERFNLLPAC